MTAPGDVIQYLEGRGRARILEQFGARSCIASTRIALEVCRGHGIEAWPQAVKVEALNARAVQAQREDVSFALGSFSLAVEGTGSVATGERDGHLVLVFKDSKGEVLLDLSADQMDRPQHDLRITKPVAVRIGDKGWPVGLWLEHGALIAYEKIPSRSYRITGDWSKRERWMPVVERIEEDLACLAA